MKKLLSIIIGAFLSTVAYSQILPGVIASGIESNEFTILHQWDFEDEDLGEYDETDINADFNPYILNWAGGDSIVMDTINGLPTKVLKIVNEAEEVQRGLQLYTFFDDLETGYDSINLSFNLKFDKDFEAVSGNGKIPGLFSMPFPSTAGQCPPVSATDTGFNGGFLYKAGLAFSDYQYTHNLDVSCPWTIDQHGERYLLSDSTYFIPGVWYTITQRIHRNTNDGAGLAHPNGINEVWVYDDMIFQMDTMRYLGHDTMMIDGIGFRSFQSAPSTTIESSVSIDNMTAWTPKGDANFDNGTLHSTSYKMVSPVDITDRTVYYDYFISEEDTVTTSGYPSVLPSGSTEAWLFDAGEGNTITATFLDGQTSGGAHIFFYDTNDADGPILDWQVGYTADLTDDFGGDGAVTSSDRYLYMLTTMSEGTPFTKFRVKIEINTP